MSDVWLLTDGTNTWKIIDVDVVKTLDGLNNATVTLKDDIALDIVVDMLYGSSTVLKGYVKSKTKTHDGLYKYEIVELAVELENQIVTDTDGSYTFIVTDATVNDVVDTILSGSGWTRGSSDTTSLGAVSFTYTRKLPALFKVLKELRGHKVWFDSTTKTVYFGDSRDDEGTLDYFTLSQETSTRNRNIDKVVVFSNDESVYAEYGSGDIVAIYKYTSAKTEEECSLIAQRIYDELSQPYERIEVETKIDPNIDEGDLVTIDSVTYVVYRVEYNMFTMKVHLNENIHSIFDILGSKIIEMTGSISTLSLVTDTISIPPSNTPTVYKLAIPDVSLVEEAVLEFEVGAHIIDVNAPFTADMAVEPVSENYVSTGIGACLVITNEPIILQELDIECKTLYILGVLNGRFTNNTTSGYANLVYRIYCCDYGAEPDPDNDTILQEINYFAITEAISVPILIAGDITTYDLESGTYRGKVYATLHTTDAVSFGDYTFDNCHYFCVSTEHQHYNSVYVGRGIRDENEVENTSPVVLTINGTEVGVYEAGNIYSVDILEYLQDGINEIKFEPQES